MQSYDLFFKSKTIYDIFFQNIDTQTTANKYTKTKLAYDKK